MNWTKRFQCGKGHFSAICLLTKCTACVQLVCELSQLVEFECGQDTID